ncbi:MAG: helix-turn-helix domain-containing protein [Bryobacteraceae bacterium]|jgi:putative transcriptional regulator
MSARGRNILKGLTELKEHLQGKRELRVYRYDVPDPIDVRAIRERSGLSQGEFARRFAISPRTLQDWEQRRRDPDSAIRAYLTVIDRDPRAVQRALEQRVK